MSDDGQSRSERARAKRRRQILAVAKHMIAEQGYHNASVADIIKEAGIARGTFYLYFEGKRALLDSVLSEALEGLRERIRSIDVDDPDAASPGVQLRENLSRVIAFVTEDQALAKILLIQGLAADAEAAAQLDRFYSEVRGLVAHALTRGMNLGLVRSCDAALVAAVLVGAVRGLVEYSLGQETEVDAIVDELLQFALAAVFAKK